MSRSVWCFTRSAKRASLGIAIAALACAFTVFQPPPTSGPYLRDFEAYWSAGVTWLHGGDPYRRTIWSAERTVPGVDPHHDELLPFIGPAAFRPFWSALGTLPFGIASRVWAVLLVLSASTIALGSILLAGVERRALTASAAFAAVFAFGPCTSAMALGQGAIVAAAAIVIALAASERGLPGATAAATFLAAIQPNLALPLIAALRDRRTVAAVAAAFATFVIATFAFGGGLAGFARYASAIAHHGTAERNTIIQSTSAAIAWGLGASDHIAHALGIAVSVATLAIVVVAVARLHFDRVEAVAFASAALPLASPFFHEHDFAIAFLPAMVVARRCGGAALAIGLAGAVAVGVDWLNFAQRPDAYAQHIAQAVALAGAFLAIARRPNRTTVAILAATIVITAAIAAVAARYPAPVWPDNLPSHYHAPPRADASAVWHDEQRRSGLERQVPAWALLRIPALGGSVLIVIALAMNARPRVYAQSTDSGRRLASSRISVGEPHHPQPEGAPRV